MATSVFVFQIFHSQIPPAPEAIGLGFGKLPGDFRCHQVKRVSKGQACQFACGFGREKPSKILFFALLNAWFCRFLTHSSVSGGALGRGVSFHHGLATTGQLSSCSSGLLARYGSGQLHSGFGLADWIFISPPSPAWRL